MYQQHLRAKLRSSHTKKKKKAEYIVKRGGGAREKEAKAEHRSADMAFQDPGTMHDFVATLGK